MTSPAAEISPELAAAIASWHAGFGSADAAVGRELLHVAAEALYRLASDGDAPARAHARQAVDDALREYATAAGISAEMEAITSAARQLAAPAEPKQRAAATKKERRKQVREKVKAREIAATAGADRRDRPENDAALNRVCAFFPLTDLGNADRFVARNRGKFLWCAAIGWLAWDGRRYVRAGAGGQVEEAICATVRAIQDEATVIAGTKDDFAVNDDGVMWSETIARWGRVAEGASHIACIGRGDTPGLAGAFVAIKASQLDADPMMLNVANGTLVFRRDGERDYVTFRPHDPADLMTKICPVKYDPNAVCPLYDRFLGEVQPDVHVRRFLHQWGGLSLTGDISEQKMSFWWGKGKNGKSTLAEAFAYVAGDYATNTPIQTFLDQGRTQSAGQATPQLAKLAGVRMLRTSEPERGSKIAEGLIKLVTGGDMIDARHLNREFFSYVSQFKLVMSGNYRPAIIGTDEGIWRRILLVPWLVQIPLGKRDKFLLAKLCAEGSGILNRLLDGLRDWLDNGLVEPEAVTAATQSYRSDFDPLSRFLAACVRAASGKRVQSTVLHDVYAAWCKASGEHEWKSNGFSRALHERGFVTKISNVSYWLDIELIKTVGDFVDDAGRPLKFDTEPQQSAPTSALDRDVEF